MSKECPEEQTKYKIQICLVVVTVIRVVLSQRLEIITPFLIFRKDRNESNRCYLN